MLLGFHYIALNIPFKAPTHSPIQPPVPSPMIPTCLYFAYNNTAPSINLYVLPASSKHGTVPITPCLMSQSVVGLP